MTEDTARLLDNLATKLGTTSEYLWTVLLKQAPVAAGIGLMEVAIFAAIIVAYIKTIPWLLKGAKDNRYDVAWDIGLAVGAVASIILVFAIIINLGAAATAILNPEYWALDKILGTIKGKR